MLRVVRLQVYVGKDRVVKLPSEFPEGLAEVIVTAVSQEQTVGAATGVGLWAEVADAEYDAFLGSVHGLREADVLRRE